MNAVIFDWNGTLLADTHCNWRATNVTLRMFRKKPVSLTQYRAHWNMPIIRLYEAFGCDRRELLARQGELYRVWGDLYDKHTEKARLRRHARQTLQTLQRRNCETLILSNHTLHCITHHINRLGIADHFTTVLANAADAANFTVKGKGERLRLYAQKKGIKRALVIGDTEEEIEIARDHGYVSVAITDGVCSTARLVAAKPDFLIRSLGEIPAIATRVFGRAS